MKRCGECLKKKKSVEAVKIYNPNDFGYFEIRYVCGVCQDNYLADCDVCGKSIYDTSRPATDWDSLIPYEKEFKSDAERHQAISEMEAVFFCDHCCPADAGAWVRGQSRT